MQVKYRTDTRDVDRAIADLIRSTEPQKAKRQITQALADAMQPMAEYARQHAADRSGRLQDAIVVSPMLKRQRRRGPTPPPNPNLITMYVGVAAGNMKRGVKGAKYAHMIEFGTAPHTIRARRNNLKGLLQIWSGSPAKVTATAREIRHPGLRPRPFLRPAFEAEGMNTIRRLLAPLEQYVALNAARAARPTRRRKVL